jgi:hypothetical protein
MADCNLAVVVGHPKWWARLDDDRNFWLDPRGFDPDKVMVFNEAFAPARV